MSSSIIPISSPNEIVTLDKTSLDNLFRSALPEAERIQTEMDKIITAKNHIQQLRNEKDVKCKINGLMLVIAFFFYIIPGIIYLVVKNNNKNKYDELIESELHNIENLESKFRNEIQNCEILYLIPNDYNNPLALKTMMKYLMNGQAENWKECSSRYDEQLHRWILEENSAQAVELQRYTAMMAELTAINTRRTATNTAISAASDFFR